MSGLDPYRGELAAALRRNEELSSDNAVLQAKLDALCIPRQRAKRPVLLLVAVAGVCAAVAGMALLAGVQERDQGQYWKSAARHDLQTLYQISEMYRATHPNAPCPTVDQLITEGEISRTSSRSDPWGQPYGIFCSANDVMVISAGPDAQLGTVDDIIVPGGPR